MKKRLTLIMTVFTLIMGMLLPSCGETAKTEEESKAVATEAVATQAVEIQTSAEDQTTAEPEPEFVADDLGGREFTVYMRSESASSYPGIYIAGEEVNGELMNDNVVARNKLVEEKYNLKITTVQTDSPYKTVKSDVSGGTVTYDLILDRRSKLASLATSGCLANLSDCTTDFSTAWWDENGIETYDINNHRYFIINDVSVSNMAGAEFYYFNIDMLEDYKLTSPYEYYKNNQWTWETFITLVNSVSNTAIDGSLGVYGLMGAPSARTLLTTSGVSCISKVDGEYKTLIGTDYAERAQAVFDLVKDAFSNAQSVISRSDCVKISPLTETFANDSDHARALFAGGHFLFIHGNMKISNQFSDMQDQYGIAVYPKFNGDQERYYAPMDEYSIIWCIPNVSNVDAQEVLNVLDYWAYQSSKTVFPAYYELTLKGKRSSNVDGANMLDVIKQSICYDMSDIYAISSLENGIDACYTAGSISTFKSYSTAINLSIKSVVTALDKLD